MVRCLKQDDTTTFAGIALFGANDRVSTWQNVLGFPGLQ